MTFFGWKILTAITEFRAIRDFEAAWVEFEVEDALKVLGSITALAFLQRSVCA
jgi:hypothetical protein